MIDARNSDGFTLVETLAALSILALAMTSLLASYNSGIRAAHASRQYLRAQMLAQSLLAETTSGRQRPLQVRQGRTGGFDWVIAATASTENLPLSIRGDRWKLYRIVVSVRWGAREVRLDSHRIARGDL